MVTFRPPNIGREHTEVRHRTGPTPPCPSSTSTAVRYTSTGRADTNGIVPTTAEEPPSALSADDSGSEDVKAVGTPASEKDKAHTVPDATDTVTDSETNDPFRDAPNEKLPPQTDTLVQPRFSTIKLPGKYNRFDLETRLWLQSRAISGRDIEDTSFASTKAPRRKLSWANLCLALDLVLVLAPAGWTFVTSSTELLLRLLFFLLGRILAGSISSIELIASSSLLGLVDLSVKGIEVPLSEAIWTGVFSVLLHLATPLHGAVFDENTRVINEMTTKQANRAVLAMSLSQTITESHDPLHSAMLQEASAVGRGGSPITAIGALVSTASALGSQAIIVYRVLKKGDSIFCAGNIFVLGMALGPVIVTRLHKLWKHWRALRELQTTRERNERYRRRGTMQTMATSPVYKPEALIYRLKDWILSEYDKADKTFQDQDAHNQLEKKAASVIKIAMRHAIDSTFYVLIVTRQAPASLSLASMNLLSTSLSKTFRHMGGLQMTMEDLVNEVFNMTAFHACHVHTLEHTGPQIDYEAQRHPDGGMELELRDVTFSYPGADTDKPSLKGVNLRIAPGETLAIVGSNGSGKSTLLKVLLGLYNGHEGLQGDVLVNDIHMGDYDMQSIYSRAAVVMQDFQRYNLTLRENVGVGSTRFMHNDDVMDQALERGGAAGVAKKIGLETQLSPSATSAATSAHVAFTPDGGGARERNGKSGTENGYVKGARVSHHAGRSKTGHVEAAQKGGMTTTEKDDPSIEEGAVEGNGMWVEGETTSSLWNTVMRVARFITAFLKVHNSRALYIQLKRASEPDKQPASLSGGQWQRVALARAFLSAQHADMVMFDEPSSNLDPEAEADLFKTLHSLSRAQDGHRATTIYVSHRMQTVRRAQRIILLERGEIVEDGSHDELMEHKGRYHDLYSLQRDAFA